MEGRKVNLKRVMYLKICPKHNPEQYIKKKKKNYDSKGNNSRQKFIFKFTVKNALIGLLLYTRYICTINSFIL